MKLLRENATLICSVTGILFLTGPLLAHFHIVPALAGFGIFALSVVMGLLSLIGGIFLVKAGQIQTGVLVFSVGALPVIITGYSAATAGSYPRINDVSTDLQNPPVLIDQRYQAAPVTMSAEAIEANSRFYSDLAPLRMDLPAAEVFRVIDEEARARPGWVVVSSDPDAMTIHAYEQFGIFQFTDDFTIRVTSDAEGAVVDMRSKSRNGKGDLGANARRIRGFMAAVSAKF
jgi:uncharacterized protein (DUF1499 family)